MTWVWLALGSALSLSLTDLYAKRALAGLPVVAVAWVRVAFPLPVLAAAVAVAGWTPPGEGFWLALAAAVPLEILALLLYQKALQLSPLGLTAPYLAFTPAFLVVTGRWILGEIPSPWAYAGIALVCAGGYAIQLGRSTGLLGPLRALGRERGSLLVLGVAGLYSVTSALGKLAVLASAPASFALAYYAVLASALAPWGLPRLAVLRSRGVALALPVGLCGAAMVLFHFSAIRLAPASYMIAVKRSSLLWSILLGRLVLGEANLGWRLAGAALLLGGVAVLAGSL